MSQRDPQIGPHPSGMTRRRFLLGAGAAATAALLAPRLALAGLGTSGERAVSFLHTHTGERLALAYWDDGHYLEEGMSRIETFLRDFRTGERHPIDPALLDQLHALRVATGSRAPFQVISGYRSSATNEALRAGGGGQARHSLHMEGRAIDVRLADVRSSALRDAALDLALGGVGYYPSQDFVHVDTGRPRRW
ncbi:MAG TPA: DUF882 domain-containing protein [Anaeromyxobacteraceae bacterium]|nr:DUF882 domain-containing protein [Anaeromyxobacteraceae bacterium]